METPSPASAPPPPVASDPHEAAREELAALLRNVRPRQTHDLLEAMCAMGRLSKLGR